MVTPQPGEAQSAVPGLPCLDAVPVQAAEGGQEGVDPVIITIITPILRFPAVSRALLMHIHIQVLINRGLLPGSELEAKPPERKGCK